MFIAAPVLLAAQSLIALGSIWAEWLAMRWVKRFGLVVAVLGLSLLAYGWFGPAEAFLPPTAPR